MPSSNDPGFAECCVTLYYIRKKSTKHPVLNSLDSVAVFFFQADAFRYLTHHITNQWDYEVASFNHFFRGVLP